MADILMVSRKRDVREPERIDDDIMTARFRLSSLRLLFAETFCREMLVKTNLSCLPVECGFDWQLGEHVEA